MDTSDISHLGPRGSPQLSHWVVLGPAVSMMAGCTDDSSSASHGDSSTRSEPMAGAPQDAASYEPVSLGSLRQVGIVVEDIEAVTAAWTEMLGIGPWKSAAVTGTNEAGEPFSANLASAVLADVELELVQMTSGQTPLDEELSDAGEGLYNLGFFVDDVDQTVEALVADGATVLLQEPGEWAYVDSPAAEGTIVKLTTTRDTLEIDATDFVRPEGTSELSRIAHVGAFVSDAETASERWQESFDIGPWALMPFAATTTMGEAAAANLAFAAAGSTEIELVEVTVGEVSPELLRGDGRGLYEIAFTVPDPDATTQALVDRGARVIDQFSGIASLLDAGGGVAFEVVVGQ